MLALLKDMRPELLGVAMAVPFSVALNGWELALLGSGGAIAIALIARLHVYGTKLRH